MSYNMTTSPQPGNSVGEPTMAGNDLRNDNNSCSTNAQNTVLKGIPFGGVPVVLLLNFSAVLVLLLLFLVMRPKKTPSNKDVFLEPPSIIKIEMKKVKEKFGEDAFHYLRFQFHLIVLMLIMCVISLLVVLPLNMSGDLLGHDVEMFGRTTIANLPERLQWLLGFHTLVAILYIGLMGALLRHFTTIIPKNKFLGALFIYIEKKATEEYIKQYFESHTQFSEGYESVIFVEDQVYKACYKNQDETRECEGENKLIEVSKQLWLFGEEKKEQYLEPTITEEKIQKVLKCIPEDLPNQKSSVKEGHIFRHTAHPGNVYWENLSDQGFVWWLRYLIHFVLFIMLLLFTTPSIFISTMDKLNVTIPFSYLISPTIKQFFPTLLLWMFSTLLPLIVYYSTKGEAHYTRPAENKNMIYKLYIFLLLMVLILPSLGITSLDLFYLLFDDKYKTGIKLECVSLPDQGTFFVNYVITSALSGAAIELLWLPLNDKFHRACQCFGKKTPKEPFRFPYGAMYAWNLCVFTVIMAYSITCPVIVPAGLVYLILKHLVDKYNLYYAFRHPYLDRQVHLEAVKLAMAAPIICLIVLYLFSALQAGFMAWTTLFTLVVLIITITVCITRICFGIFKNPEAKLDEVSKSPGKGPAPNIQVNLMDMDDTVVGSQK